MIKTRINNEYKDIIKIFGGGTLQKEITKVWSREANKYVYESEVEYTGTLPITITADGTALIDYCIYGNTVQNGTPTPENPVEAVGCGEKTENLAPFIDEWGRGYVTDSGMIHNSTDSQERYSPRLTVKPGATYQIDYQTGSFPFVDQSDWYKQSWVGIGWYNDDGFIRRTLITNVTRTTVVAPANAKYMILSFRSFGENYNCMIIEAPIPPDTYIPYGYKLPMTVSDGNTAQTVPVYLGEVETTRRIKKLVLTGEENWSGTSKYRIGLYGQIGTIAPICTHYRGATTASYGDLVDGRVTVNGAFGLTLAICDNVNQSSLTAWKSYLTAQYAAGTPVTVWYVLAEPETAIINEPLMKIGDYADTLSMEQADVSIPTFVGTTVIDYDGAPKPSQMYIKYRR